ncbi:chaperone modulator CbpM [Paraburkholderia sp. RL17-373-BIF-A]|uniref:chaperone modulator CbpM n=1 Tax=Paraburkholderia sp. RL17-373-BIF-A TaxID=3031629 RepID=UPI0038BC1B25
MRESDQHQHSANTTDWRLAQRLAHDFQINAPGVALALDLLDEIDSLRSRVKRPRAG